MKVNVETINEEGYGVGTIGEKKVLIPYTLPGETVKIRKIRKKKGKIIAVNFAIIDPSPERKEPLCKYFGLCGGCMFQHIPYKKQLEIKTETIRKLTGINTEIIPSPKKYGYRNRIDLVTSTQGIGFRVKGHWWKVVDVDSCPLFGEKSKEAIEALREFIKSENMSLYNIRKNKGFLRYMVLREGKFTGESMVTLVTSGDGKIPETIEEYFSFATSLNWSVNPTKSDVSWGIIKKSWKREFILENILNVNYLIHPNSFFQTNSYALPFLLKTVEKFIEGEHILDMYCGVGTFGVYLSKKGLNVVGFDSNEFSIKVANKNSEINGVDAKFYVGKDKDIQINGYDTIILDPPRSGLHPKLLSRILKSNLNTIVYISCNPKTLGRDLKELKKEYIITDSIAIDMFPQTPHIETVVKLLKR